jgi:uncharacterized protein
VRTKHDAALCAVSGAPAAAVSVMKPRDSSDAEIAAIEGLCARLAGFDDRVSPEWLDGAMAALLAAPRRWPVEQWLPLLLGDAWQRTFADPDDVQQALRTLTQRWNVLASQLDAEALFDAPDELRLSPLLHGSGDDTDAAPSADGRTGKAAEASLDASGERPLQDATEWPLDGELWALGFFDAVQMLADDWVEPGEDHEDFAWYDGCIRALRLLTLHEPTELQAELQQRYPGQTLSRDDLIDEACIAVQDLRCYWVDNAPRPATRRVTAAPGRNDPCPCGSGKKYKKCHGAA